MPTNSTFLNVSGPSLLPNFTAPLPPTGFEVRFEDDPSIQLNPIEVLMCAVEMISFLANLPWTLTLHGSISMSGEGTPTEAFLNRWPPTGDSSLQVQHAVLGLYEGGLAIVQRRQYTQLTISIFLWELKVGYLEFRPDRATPHQSSDADHLTPLNSLDAYNLTTVVMASSGRVPDPYNPKFVVTYEWDGVRISSGDIFTVILDSFAIAATHDNADLDASIPAARSASGDTVLSTWTSGAKGNPQMTWARLKRALLVIWDLIIFGGEGHKARFEGFSFRLWYEGKEIGAGKMLKFDMNASQRAQNDILRK